MDDAILEAILLKCAEAGVLRSEMRMDPVHGLCVSLSGVRKMALLAPDQERAADLVRAMEGAASLMKSTPVGNA